MKQTTRDAIRQEIDSTGGMDDAIAQLSEYHTRVTVISFDKLPTYSPSMLRVLATFAEDLSQEMGEELRISMAGISRAATRDEMERSAIDNTYWKDRPRWQEMDDAE